MNILLEGKKEIIEKLKEKNPEDGEFIDKMFSIDPTSQGKYAEWIGKYLTMSLPFKDYDKIEDMITKIVIPFDKDSKRIDDNTIEQFIKKLDDSGVKLEGKTKSDVDKIKKSPKDINSYSIPFYLLAMLQVLEDTKTRAEREKLAKEGADKIYEDGNYLVVKPNTWDSSCYYGKESQWCTASKNSPGHFEDHMRRGVLYYFIDKGNPRGKVALFLERDGNKVNKRVYDSSDKEYSIDYLYRAFPDLSNVIAEITNEAPINDLLRGYVLGKENSGQILTSDNVVGFDKNEKNKGESLVKIKFNGIDDYKGLFDLYDDDNNILSAINSYYSNYDFYYMDPDSEWREGYIIRRFNDENTELLKEILKFISPKYVDADLTDENVLANISNILEEMFDRQVGNIISEYQTKMNEAAEAGVEATIEEELCEYFDSYGFVKVGDRCYNTYQTTVDNLIKLFEEYQPKVKTIRGLMTEIGEMGSVGGWAENSYEMIDWDSFDEEGFQREVNWNLEKIKDKIEETGGFGEYKEIFDEIHKKYKFDKWYKLPRKEDSIFKINGIDIDDLTISVTIRDKNNDSTNYDLDSVDEFYSLLYNYKLFDKD